MPTLIHLLTFLPQKYPPLPSCCAYCEKTTKLLNTGELQANALKFGGQCTLLTDLLKTNPTYFTTGACFTCPFGSVFAPLPKRIPQTLLQASITGEHTVLYQVYCSRNHNQIRRVNHRGILKNLFSGPIVGSGYILL